MNQVQQDLEATYDYLEEHGWCKGQYATPDGKVCLEGAAAAVTMGSPRYWATRGNHVRACLSPKASWRNIDMWGPIEWVDMPRAQIERYADVLAALGSQVPKVGSVDGSVFSFNDSHDEEEVKDLIKAAIKAETDR